MKTNENDKLIAEFMGVNDDGAFWYDGFMLHKAGLPFAYGAMGNGTSDLKFYDSWDWLMPVIHKIKNLNATFKLANLDAMVSFEHRLRNAMWIGKEKLYSEVVEFINWYDNL